MVKFVYHIQSELRDYIERCHYDIQMHARTLKFILLNPDRFETLDPELFEKYCDDYARSTIQYGLLSESMAELFLPECAETMRIDWGLDKPSCTLTLIYLDDDLDDIIDTYVHDSSNGSYLMSKEIVTKEDIRSSVKSIWRNHYGVHDGEFHRRRFEQYSDSISRMYPDIFTHLKDQDNIEPRDRSVCRTITLQVTDACNLACTYCYQINKGRRRMSLETGKKFIDMLLSGERGISSFVNPIKSPGVVIEFIGGEPLLEADLIDQLCDYFMEQTIKSGHIWANFHMFSICSNGVLYNDPVSQHLLNKHPFDVSLNITIDGNKELHDMCRLFPDGRPSYDIAVSAANDWVEKGHYMPSKITVAPENISYLYDAIKHFIEDLEYCEVNCNCVYEEGWTLEHATELYWQLKRIADYMLDTDIERDVFFAMFDDKSFHPMPISNNNNWCGGTGMMLSCDPDGNLFPCIRYMESSLGNEQPPYSIGSLETGLGCEECDKKRINCLDCITRRSQSTDECFYCPIAHGCAWCSGYNYQVNGTPDKRVTYICIMNKARAIANAYFWAKAYAKHNYSKYKCYVPDEWAIEIIGKDEWDMIKALPALEHITDQSYIDAIINCEDKYYE